MDANGYVIFNQPFYDILINSEIKLPKDREMTNRKVIGRTRSYDGSVYGKYNEDPLKNTIMYDVEFDDGTIKQYSTNISAMIVMDQ